MKQLNQSVRLLFAGGGTGGHLFPALAIANRLREMLNDDYEPDIHFVGTKRGLEFRIRETLGYPLHLINIRGLTRSLTLKNIIVPFLLVGALIRANSLLKQLKPDLVIGTGGYVSLPILKAASYRGIPTVLQEQNSFPGLSTRKAAKDAARIYLGFDAAKKYLATEAELILTGNPVRSDLGSADRSDAIREFSLDPDKKTILVLGGSQGARKINQAIMKSLRGQKIPEGYQLLWQTGKREFAKVIAQAGDQVKSHSLFPFENRMALVYAAADIAIARAGAITISELQSCSVPAILIPYPFAAGDHQRHNAISAEESGFARVIDEEGLSRFDLANEAAKMLESGEAERMSEAMRAKNAERLPSVEIICNDILALLEIRPATGGGGS